MVTTAGVPPSDAPRLDCCQHVENCIDLARAAVDGDLLASAATIEQGLTDRGGQWNPPAGLDAGVLSWLSAISVEFTADGDDYALAAAGEEAADRLAALPCAPDSRCPLPDTDQVEALWESPDLAVVVSSLPSWSSKCGFAGGVTPTGALWLKLSRSDVTDTQDDAERTRPLARHGSSVERWHVAGQAPLPDDVVALLDDDEDVTVVLAVRAGADRREFMSTRPCEQQQP